MFTLPVVVLISLMAQPRLQLAMAQDGILPGIFSRVDEWGNLKWGTFLSGVAMVLTATFVPFIYLDDLISVGILVAFSMTNSCLILLRCESPPLRPLSLEKHLAVYNGCCLVTGLLCSHAWHTPIGVFFSIVSFVATIGVAISMSVKCPQSIKFGGSILSPTNINSTGEFFRTPFVPYLPCAGIFINWFLISQLEISGLLLLFLYLGMSLIAYFCFCHNSSFESSVAWKRGTYQSLSGEMEEEKDAWLNLKQEFSMPEMSGAVSTGKAKSSGYNLGTLT